MIIAFVKYCLCVLFAGTLIINPAYADDETKRLIGGIAAGLVGLAIQEMADNPSESDVSKDDIQWSNPSSQSLNTTQNRSKPQIQYDPRIEQIQTYLSTQGYYNGVIDGLNGKGTQTAINAWEFDHIADDYNKNGYIDDLELNEMRQMSEEIIQSERIKNSKKAKIKQIKKIDLSEKSYSLSDPDLIAVGNQIVDFEWDYLKEASKADLCSQYQTKTGFLFRNASYSNLIDEKLQIHIDKYQYLHEHQIHEYGTCIGLDEKYVTAFREKAKNEFRNNVGNHENARSAFVASRDPQEEPKFVEECNAFSSMMIREINTAKDSRMNTNTCEYEIIKE